MRGGRRSVGCGAFVRTAIAGVALCAWAAAFPCLAGTPEAVPARTEAQPRTVMEQREALPALEGAADAVNAFSLELFGRLAAKNAGANIVLSPYSLNRALAVTALGARGQTRDGMLAAMRMAPAYPVRNPGSAHYAFARLAARLSDGSGAFSGTEPASGATGKAAVFRTADTILHSRDLRLNAAFGENILRYYDAYASAVDFADPAKVIETANAWAAEHTGGAIKELLAPGSLSADSKLVILDAVAFRGAWLEAFPAADTVVGKFRTAGGEVEAPFMRNTVPLEVISLYDDAIDPETGEDAELARMAFLPFAGMEWEMAVVLPESMPALLARLSPAKLCEWFGARSDAQARGRRPQPVALSMPKFAFDWTAEGLPAVLAEMGMGTAFDSASADFSGIASANLCLSNVLHRARIEVDEAGAAAAAASAAIMGKGMPESFDVDGPFLFLIRHVETGAVALMGVVANPAAH